jgi:hypothetical protein
MYIQWFAKGIGGQDEGHDGDLATWSHVRFLIGTKRGIQSNWWRKKGIITPQEVAAVLTETNLDRHLHDYDTYGPDTPFISLAAGCVERDALAQRNWIYSARDTALEFATDSGTRPGAVFYGWTIVGLNPAVRLSAISESVRELNVYRRWSPYQLEGEITAKVHIPANQIQSIEWWEPSDLVRPAHTWTNPDFTPPDPILNVRELF